MSSLDKDTSDKLEQEMSTLPLSAMATNIVAASTTTAAAHSATAFASLSSAENAANPTPVSNPSFLSNVITGAVNEAVSSSSFSR